MQGGGPQGLELRNCITVTSLMSEKGFRNMDLHKSFRSLIHQHKKIKHLERLGPSVSLVFSMCYALSAPSNPVKAFFKAILMCWYIYIDILPRGHSKWLFPAWSGCRFGVQEPQTLRRQKILIHVHMIDHKLINMRLVDIKENKKGQQLGEIMPIREKLPLLNYRH